MRAVLIALTSLLVVAPAAIGFDRVITPGGTVGKVSVTRAAHTTMAKVRRQEGRAPDNVAVGADQYEWRYRCAGGHRSTYFFDASKELIGFTTSCSNWRTQRGTRVGTGWKTASRREHRKHFKDECAGGYVIGIHNRTLFWIRFPAKFARVDLLEVWRINGLDC